MWSNDKYLWKIWIFKEAIISITKEGASGAEEIKNIMERIRNNTPSEIGKYKVLKFRDYKKDIIKDMTTGETTSTGLPNSNVLYFDFDNDAWCCVRPSGTEPKIKFYVGIKEDSMEKAQESLEEIKKEIEKMAN